MALQDEHKRAFHMLDELGALLADAPCFSLLLAAVVADSATRSTKHQALLQHGASLALADSGRYNAHAVARQKARRRGVVIG